ncbi:MAG: hypothetical protein WC732_04050 [Candidatus Omnitrophota bacterium]
MSLYLKKILLLVVVISLAVPPQAAFAVSPSQYLTEIALKYYHQGSYQEALHELNKAVLADPRDAEARFYLEKLKIENQSEMAKDEVISQSLDDFEATPSNMRPSREDVIRQELESISSRDSEVDPAIYRKMDKPARPAPVRTGAEGISKYVDIKGDYQVSAGVHSPDELIWKEANADLNERNWRILWSDSRYNTFDPAIYDRLRVIADTVPLRAGDGEFSAHANLTVDPWSFTGKTETFTVAGEGGDSVELELKYWSNTGRTINEAFNTLQNGDAIATPEIKVIDGKTSPASVSSTFGNIFNIPSQDIERSFMPLREFWVDYRVEDLKIRFFPIAYQDQALSSGDPLGVSNHHTWWEESPWLADWKPGTLNTGATPNDFTKGEWDDSLAFFTRDSDGVRLTSLRGFSFAYEGVDGSLKSTFASPRNLWADYGDFQTYALATRLDYDLLYNMGLGLTHAGHFGFNEKELDGLNNVFSIDAKFEPVVGSKLIAQVATSESSYDRSNEIYASKKRGQAYFVSLVNRFPKDDLFEQDYEAIKRGKDETWYVKSRMRLARMDTGFESTLANYSQTRDDEFWSRHISFRKHPLYIYTGLTKPMRFDDIRVFGIGDGIDSGRSVISWRIEGEKKIFEHYLKTLLDVRNVHHSQTGAFIENVARLEVEYPMTDRLMTRFLGIRHNLHKTYAGVDPFVFNEDLDQNLVNTAIPADQDPSLSTFSLGFEYRLTDWFSYSAVYEHTNDQTVATDNYPRGLFNSSSFTTVTEDGKVYREPIPFLYSQQYFDQPPYDYFDIYKFGFSFRPTHKLEFYLDFAYNENKTAGQIDDNMNHYGLEVAYVPTDKLSFIFKYTQSRWLDLLYLNDTGESVYSWHHNFFFETRYQVNNDAEWILLYGVGGITPLGSATYDPFGGALAVLDTQHLFRLYYKKRF